ncbi:DedA family protein [candidate division TA06 bacterium]|uniref:DedA family protein n=1 Tax=candidate division TA06 bacterium TaxID=2250710 RepID=A0A933MK98_UNCT6|nr:DedA family protein [candidate division TA06 bacterium]
MILRLIDIFIHLDKYLTVIIQNYGTWTYLMLFAVIFCETGLVVLPFLPGDSLIFAAGTLAALGALDIKWLIILMCLAAVAGDTVNYWIGYWVGPKIFQKENVKFLNKKHLMEAHAFYEKYGGITIILARFMPFIRTFAPFVAGIGTMSYWRFMSYNVVGGIAWINIFGWMGYYFGNLPYLKKNFSLVIIAIVVISVMPAVIEYFRRGQKTKNNKTDL